VRRAAWVLGVALLAACGGEADEPGDASSDAVTPDALGGAAESDTQVSAPGRDAAGAGSQAGAADDAGSARAPDTASVAPPPHVLLVVLEAVRADHVGAYGYGRPTTPRLDALAAAGLVHERAYAASSVTSQSLAALWTGRLPSSGGATGLAEARPHPSLPSLPRLFAASGARTALVTNHRALWYRGFTRGFDELEVDSVPGRWSAPDVVERALHVVDGWRAADARADAGGRMPRSLLVVDLSDAREPHVPVPAARALMDAPPVEPWLSLDAVRAQAGALPDDLVDSPGFRDLVARYDAEIAMVDDQLGALVDGLAARGRLRDTLLVVTASHGVEWLEHGYVGSGWTLHEEVLRVPLVLHAPGWLGPARVPGPVSLVDVAPTLAALYDLAGRETRFDGRPLLAAGEGGLRPRDRGGDVIAELVVPELATLRAVIRGEHKLVRTLTGFAPGQRLAVAREYAARVAAMQDGELARPDPWGVPARVALFDLGADPGELIDRAAAEPDLVQALADVLDRYGAFCRDNAPAAREAARVQQRDAAAELLEQLGYL